MPNTEPINNRLAAFPKDVFMYAALSLLVASEARHAGQAIAALLSKDEHK